jgi:hypothetical protein
MELLDSCAFRSHLQGFKNQLWKNNMKIEIIPAAKVL